MPPASDAPDALERLATLLAHTLRAGGRGDPTQSVEVGEIFQTLIPYRRVRDDARLDSAEDYELALLQLLAGERGFASGDPAMQERIQLELSEAVPDLTLYKAYARARIALNPGTVVFRRLSAPSPVAAPVLAAVPVATFAPPPPVAPVAPAVPVAPAKASPMAPVASPVEEAVARPTPRSVTVELGTRCRYCSQELPPGRQLTYCPHCGQNLTVLQCPACSAEMEMGWKFCTTCGRSSAIPAPPG